MHRSAVTQYFHNMLWINHFRTIPEDCVVVHKNGITVDNRLINLELVEVRGSAALLAMLALFSASRICPRAVYVFFR